MRMMNELLCGLFVRGRFVNSFRRLGRRQSMKVDFPVSRGLGILLSRRYCAYFLLGSSNTPMPMINPSTLLTLLTTILRPPTPPTLCKLSRIFLPLPTLIICTLPNPTPRIILSAQIPHYDSCPVLHILTVMTDGEFFD
jgi:hypothetical protein